MTRIVGLVQGGGDRGLFREALRSGESIEFRGTCRELADRGAAGDVDAVVVEPRDRDGVSTGPAVAALRARFPALAVLVYLSNSPADVRDLMSGIGKLDGVALAFRGIDDVGVRLREALAAAAELAVAARIVAAAGPRATRLPPALQAAVALCVRTAGVRPSVHGLAAELGVDRRTLLRTFRRGGLGTPRLVIAWSRLLHAAQLLEGSARPVAHVARELGFPSAPAFHAAVARHVGVGASALRAPGAFETVMRAFVRALERAAGGTAAGRR
jgi:AraC-like DNA-binding protein